MANELTILAILAVIILLGFLGYLLFERTRISDVLLLMAFGLLVGPILGLFPVDGFQAAIPLVGALALIIIMFDGGLGLSLKDLMSGLARSAILAVVGFAATAAAVAAVGHYWMGMDWMTAALLGTILGGTSGIIIMPLVARTSASNNTRVMLSVESALTDVLCVIGAVTIISLLATSGGAFGQGELLAALQGIASKFSIAIVIGLIVGFVWLRTLKVLEKRKYSYMMTLAAVLGLYTGTEVFGGTGAIAVLIFGIVLGNGWILLRKFDIQGLTFSDSQRQFQGEIAFLIRVFFFVYIGIILDPTILTNQTFLIAGSLLIVGLLAARLLAVLLSTWGDRTTRPDRGLMTFLMPRGLAAVVLAGLPMQAGIVGTENFLAYAFLVLVATNLITTVAVVFFESRKTKARIAALDDLPAGN